MHLVLFAKKLIQKFRYEKRDELLAIVISFCEECDIEP